MSLRAFQHKLRGDFRGLMRYPQITAGEDMRVDYDVYWERRGGSRSATALSAWQKERADIALRYLSEGDSVIDLGAGAGAMLSYWRERRGIKPVAVEVSQHSLAALRDSGIEAIEADINDPSTLELLPIADYITGFEVLEHVANPETVIRALQRKARKGLIFSFPNTGYYAHRLRLLCGRFPLQWIAHPGEHLRFWTVADVRSWVPQIGVRLVALVPYQGLPGLNKVWPALFAQGILIVLE